MWFVIIVQIGVPLILIGAIMIVRQPSRARWLGSAAAFGMVIIYLLVSARWDVSSLYLRLAIPVLYIGACVIGYRRIRVPEKQGGRPQWLAAWAINLGLMVLMSGYLWFSLRGLVTPEGAVDLASPLSGRYVVLNGGASPFTNAHFRRRPQDYALDLVGVNGLGARAALFGDSRELGSYVIYGAPVFSPCDGRISVAVDGLPDHIPPARDTENPAGNHVLLECGDIEVLLAHLRKDSLVVTVGAAVATGEQIGLVGNSGNTSEPHLHIHAERGGRPGIILDGEAVPVTIDGRFLVRNSIVRNHGAGKLMSQPERE